MENTGVFEDLIFQNRISMKVQKVPLNPVTQTETETDTDAMEHYRCSLLKPGKQMDAYFSVTPDEGRPSLSDVLFMLAMDASGCKMLEGLRDYRDAWDWMFGGSDGNIHELEEFWVEYCGRCQQSEAFRNFIGDSDYQRLIHSFEQESNLPHLPG